MPNCPSTHHTPSYLDAENRKCLALEVLAKKHPVTRIAERNNVSRKFLYHQAAKASAALDKAFEGKTEPDEVLLYLPITKSWLCQFVLALAFRHASTLDGLYPSLVHHAITTFSYSDLPSFLGRKPKVHHDFRGEVGSDYKNRAEGVGITHRLNLNSIKMDNKESSILRLETTINDTNDFKVFRTKEG